MVRELLAGGISFDTGVANYGVRQIQRNGPPQDTYDNLAAHSARNSRHPDALHPCHDGVGHLEPGTRIPATRSEDFEDGRVLARDLRGER
jgi:hypothetical protein